ncbi:MAG TPA: FkbM family methyltransferase [Vicinamibacterales bacterium]|nr:FkbM family methyltransferase [Vicinamibacterales bacterium]
MGDHGVERAGQLMHTLRFIANHPLNRGRRVRAFNKFLQWQIRSRLAPGPVVYPWVNGSKVMVRPGETGVTGNVYCGLHEFEDMAYLLHVIGPADLFVDVGANVGVYTILACAVRGAKGICFEPVPATYARLLENIRLNALSDRVQALNVGVADKDGELLFTSDENTMNHVVVNDADDPNDAHTVRVGVSTLDLILENQRPSLLKIDVEGFETRVLAGAVATLGDASLNSVIIELNGSGERYGFDETAIPETMAGFGFTACRYEPFARSLEPLAGGTSATGNTLFVRDLALAKQRISVAPPVTVDGVRL